uniref:Uncharacterized protein n=1 Tax=Octopus bimaculoides TaxID=37653 RepID=A0A0L8FRN4_OCTBM
MIIVNYYFLFTCSCHSLYPKIAGLLLFLFPIPYCSEYGKKAHRPVEIIELSETTCSNGSYQGQDEIVKDSATLGSRV